LVKVRARRDVSEKVAVASPLNWKLVRVRPRRIKNWDPEWVGKEVCGGESSG